MKNILFLSALFFLLFFGLPKAGAQKFHGGATLGLVGSQVAGDTYSGYHKAGLYGGGFVNLELGKHSLLQMELTYFQKGSHVNPDSANNYTTYTLRLNYVELPLLYQYQVKKWIFEAGPSLGFNVGYFEEFNGQTEFNNNEPTAVTLQINVGIRFFITEHFGIDFRTNNSLLNVRKNNVTGDVWRFWGYGQFNDALVFSVFYQFR
jgi:hypothetical protein